MTESVETERQPVVMEQLPIVLESLLYAAERPLTLKQIQEVIGERDAARVEVALAELAAHYATRGIQLAQVAGGYSFRTSPETAVWVQRLLGKRPVRLTRSQLETLSIISYRQPITRPEIEEIRGVDSGAVLRTLLERSLVRVLGKKEEPGRPLLYGTSKEFLEFFNLKDLRDLPTLREYHELSREHQMKVEDQSGVIRAAMPEPEDLLPFDTAEEAELLGELAQAERAAAHASSHFAPKIHSEESGAAHEEGGDGDESR